ncbi:MAG: hypothetical protein OEQ53_16475, partial [Saprospiraceae bacterium]|nr:hypothetical protein [Saprospiraceae bacterium]
MNYLFRLLIVIVPILISNGCDEDPSQKVIVLGQDFTLNFQEEGMLKDAAIKVSFESVLEDSRCPSDVQCVWAGQVKVLLHFTEVNR